MPLANVPSLTAARRSMPTSCPRFRSGIDANEAAAVLDIQHVQFCQAHLNVGALLAGEAYVPFCPVRAMAVDLFPHTRHVESVVLLQRD
jgi:hypothetical protein